MSEGSMSASRVTRSSAGAPAIIGASDSVEVQSTRATRSSSKGSGGEAVKDVMEGFQTPDGTMATRRSSRSASGAHNVAAPFQKPGHSDSTTVEKFKGQSSSSRLNWRGSYKDPYMTASLLVASPDHPDGRTGSVSAYDPDRDLYGVELEGRVCWMEIPSRGILVQEQLASIQRKKDETESEYYQRLQMDSALQGSSGSRSRSQRQVGVPIPRRVARKDPRDEYEGRFCSVDCSDGCSYDAVVGCFDCRSRMYRIYVVDDGECLTSDLPHENVKILENVQKDPYVAMRVRCDATDGSKYLGRVAYYDEGQREYIIELDDQDLMAASLPADDVEVLSEEDHDWSNYKQTRVKRRVEYNRSERSGGESESEDELVRQKGETAQDFYARVSSHAAARSNSRRQGYSLRRHRTKPVQFKSHTPQKVRDSSRSGVKRARDEPINFRRRHRRRRHYDSSSSSDSCQASSSDEGGGTWKEVKGRIKPLNSGAGDVTAMGLQEVGWESVGGLGKHVKALQEMVFLPLLYPDLFSRIGASPPRGVLFHGPPGTGKTLVARALAASCCSSGRTVSFFMRKGADVLCKWVGEAEKQIRMLFEAAREAAPSIIFFDEIDGLAPVRSSKQDQIHSSVVTTLLAQMDGLDSRGQVLVIGATNRIDAVDPALRRPGCFLCASAMLAVVDTRVGRFDREYLFPLPDISAREEILRIHTAKWNPQLQDSALKAVARVSNGMCGADLRALCAEAAMRAVRRQYPQIYNSKNRLLIPDSDLNIQAEDLMAAVAEIPAASARVAPPLAQPLPALLVSNLSPFVDSVHESIVKRFPISGSSARAASVSTEAGESFMQRVHRPRMLLFGDGSDFIAPAVLHALDSTPVIGIGITHLMPSSIAKMMEEALVLQVAEARRRAPSILYLPDVIGWLEYAPEPLKQCLKASLAMLPSDCPVLLLATAKVNHCGAERNDVPTGVREDINALFPARTRVKCPECSTERMIEVMEPLLDAVVEVPPLPQGPAPPLPVLEEAPPPPPDPVLNAKLMQDDAAAVRELRLRLRSVLRALLGLRRFREFMHPVSLLNPSIAEEYGQIIEHPMDLSTMREKLDARKYPTVEDFLGDVSLIEQNAHTYNVPGDNPEDLAARSRNQEVRSCATDLREEAEAMIARSISSHLQQRCVSAKARSEAAAKASAEAAAQASRGRRESLDSSVFDVLESVTRGARASRSSSILPSEGVSCAEDGQGNESSDLSAEAKEELESLLARTRTLLFAVIDELDSWEGLLEVLSRVCSVLHRCRLERDRRVALRAVQETLRDSQANDWVV